MRARSAALLSLALAATLSVGAVARAGVADEKLGEAYQKAKPAEKVLQLAIASADKVIKSQDARAALEEITLAVVKPGETPEAKLKLLGAFRKEVKALTDAANKERRKQKKRYASTLEPSGDLQSALALSYISTAAGPRPTLEKLACLALVRESTSWSSHYKLVLAVAHEAFSRDEAFMKGDFDAKLARIKVIAEDKKMLSNHERSGIENMVLSEWISAQLASGKKAAEILADVDKRGRNRQLCFFSSSWAKGILREMIEIGR